MTVMSEEAYLISKGYGQNMIGNAELHRNPSQKSPKQWGRLVEKQRKIDVDVIVRRGELRAEYRAQVAAGEIRPPTAKEKTIWKANGHPDNESTQAARRICARRGWEWRQDESSEN